MRRTPGWWRKYAVLVAVFDAVTIIVASLGGEVECPGGRRRATPCTGDYSRGTNMCVHNDDCWYVHYWEG